MERALVCVLVIGAACSIRGIDYTNKACPCPGGFVCELATMTCQQGTAAIDAASDGASDGPSDQTCACSVSNGISITAGSGCYCIDATEVTQGAYAGFLAAGEPPATLPECSWKTTNVPSGTWPPPNGTLEYPVASVDWCDAAAFCAWDGKRLCGVIGAGPASTGSPNATTDQWYRACSAAGALAYPYGNAYNATACWANQPAGGSVAVVASNPGCEGGFPGLFDMSGNVNEWIDACNAATGATDVCIDLGGGKFYSGTDLDCSSIEMRPRNDRHSDVGFRCCWP